MVHMSKLTVRPSTLKGEVSAQPSKSYTHRVLSIALLSDGKSRISNGLFSLDTRATIEAVDSLGGEVRESDQSWNVTGTGGNIEPRKKVIDVRNSGTTLRLMSAISSLSKDPVKLTGDESILERPMGPMIESLQDLGARAECKGRNGRPPVIVGGGLEGGETSITGSVSSQFISALLIASPFSEVGVDLEVEDELNSKPYVEMTLKVLEMAGAEIKSSSSLMNYSIPGGQELEPFSSSVPGDFSSAAFILGAGAFSKGGVKMRNLDPKDVQGDKRILELLEEFGAEVDVEENSVMVKRGGQLEGIDVDCSNTPDLVPILSVLGSVAEGPTRIQNVPHLRFKEVDRLKALASELKKMGVEVKELEDGLKISGSGGLKSGELESYGDHRIAMALAIAGLVADEEVKINGAESVKISYPDFVSDMESLGAKISVEG